MLGASGVIGRALLPELARSYEVVAVSRRPHPQEPGIAWAQVDVTDAGSLPGLLREGDLVVYLVHSLGTSDFERVDLLAAENVALRAQLEGALAVSSRTPAPARRRARTRQ